MSDKKTWPVTWGEVVKQGTKGVRVDREDDNIVFTVGVPGAICIINDCPWRRAYRILRDEVRRLRGGLRVISSGRPIHLEASDRAVARATLDGHTICLECGKEMEEKTWREDIPEFHYCEECQRKE